MSSGYQPPAPTKPTLMQRWNRLPRWAQIALVVLVVAFLIYAFSSSPETSDDEADDQPTQSAETAAPSESAATTTPAASDCEGLTDVTSTRPLCEFEDSDSYAYRLALATSIDEVLPMVQAVAPWTEATDLSDLYGTCDDVASGNQKTIANAATRFSAGPDEQVTEKQATKLVDIAARYICQ